MPAERRTVGSVLNKMIDRVNSNIRRLRILEQESSIFKTRLTSNEQEVMAQRNQLNRAVKDMGDKIARLENRISGIEQTIKEIIDQFKKVATASKIKELEEMIEIYNPIKSQFATKEEIRRMIEEGLEE